MKLFFSIFQLTAVWFSLLYSSAASGQQLVTVHAGSVSDRAVVFVHGLCGDPDETFGLWPQLWLDDATIGQMGVSFNHVDIFSLSYDSLFATDIDIRKVITAAAESLRGAGIYRDYNHIWFVTHSLGGLVVKKLVLDHARAGRNVMVDRVAGIFFNAVPHKGSGLADAADKLPSAVVEWLLCDNSELVADLVSIETNAFLDDLDQEWDVYLGRRWKARKSPFVFCSFELEDYDVTGKGWGKLPGVKVVRQAAAATKCSEPPHPIKADHRSIVKPDSNEAPVYQWVRERFFLSEVGRDSDPAVRIIPGNQTLHKLVAYWKKQRTDTEYWGPSGLPPIEVLLEIAPESEALAQRLRLVNGPGDGSFSGPTLRRTIERLTEYNNCISAVSMPSERRVELSITGPLKECVRGGRTSSICASRSCP